MWIYGIDFDHNKFKFALQLNKPLLYKSLGY
jgi:hypothetical protein